MQNQVEYYRDPRVRHAMCTFLEGCEYLVGFGEAEVWKGAEAPYYSAPGGWPHLERMLESGLDVFASLWRQDCTVGVVDMEYFNHQVKGLALTEPGYAMACLRPAVEQFLVEFDRRGLPFLGLVTGQGVQLCFKVPFEDPVHDDLVRVGFGNEGTLQEQYDRAPEGKRQRAVPWHASVGNRGIFRCELKICNDVLRGLQARRDQGEPIMPAVYSDIHMGPPGGGLAGIGQEGVSVDLTLFGDPLHMRDHRAAFSTHQKQRADPKYTDVYAAPLKITLPFWHLDQFDRVAAKREEEAERGETDFEFAAAWAGDVGSCVIPTAAWAVGRVIGAIEDSPLGSFFAHFDGQHFNHDWDWPSTYYSPDLLPSLPPCVRAPLEHPDPNLLKPTNLQRLVRVLDKMGWHPKHIAGLIYSRYVHMPWGYYNPERRANYWVEQYAGPIHDGTDDKRYMSCEEEQARGFCPQPFCGFDLKGYR